MDEIPTLLIASWMRNQQANQQILQEADEMLSDSKSLTSIYSQFAHVHTIRYYNIEKQDRKFTNKLTKLSGKQASDHNLVGEQLSQSAKAISAILESYSPDQIKSYHTGAVGWICYLINHEAHHRCKAMMIMKSQGVKFSKRLKFDLWNWK